MTLAIQWNIQEIGVHFFTTTANRFFVHTGDEGELCIARTVRFLGEHADVPTSLRFRETTEQEIDLTMVAHHLRIGLLLAHRTFALV